MKSRREQLVDDLVDAVDRVSTCFHALRRRPAPALADEIRRLENLRLALKIHDDARAEIGIRNDPKLIPQ